MFGRRKTTTGNKPSIEAAEPESLPKITQPKSASLSRSGATMSSTRNTPPPMRPEIARRRVDLPGVGARAPETGEAAVTEGKKLIVGRDIFLTGEITACNKLIIEGRVEASLAESQSMEIAAAGHFKGTAEVETADISGRFEGKLTVKKRLSIRSTGRVVGEIRYGEIEIECGGMITGDVRTVEEPVPVAESAAAEAGSVAAGGD
jgi:cytoskeletal protein CcmA (bactofilin family)